MVENSCKFVGPPHTTLTGPSLAAESGDTVLQEELKALQTMEEELAQLTTLLERQKSLTTLDEASAHMIGTVSNVYAIMQYVLFWVSLMFNSLTWILSKV